MPHVQVHPVPQKLKAVQQAFFWGQLLSEGLRNYRYFTVWAFLPFCLLLSLLSFKIPPAVRQILWCIQRAAVTFGVSSGGMTGACRKMTCQRAVHKLTRWYYGHLKGVCWNGLQLGLVIEIHMEIWLSLLHIFTGWRNQTWEQFPLDVVLLLFSRGTMQMRDPSISPAGAPRLKASRVSNTCPCRLWLLWLK